VMLIWLRKWPTTLRTTFCFRLHSPCCLRLTRAAPMYSAYSS